MGFSTDTSLYVINHDINGMSVAKTQHALENLKPTDLPTPPQAEIRIVQACSDENVTSKQLATLISSDPVITAELLRMVNSAFYGLSREVSTINHAVTILGQRALRNLALCLSVRDALKDDYIHGFKIEEYWEDALRRAVTARALGKIAKLDHDECFTIGLLQDFGMLAVFHTQPELSHLWEAYRKIDPEQRYKLEQKDFGITHDKAGLMLGCAWELPQELISAMAYHHHGDYKNMKPQDLAYCKIALCADWVAAVFTAEEKADTLKSCKKLLKNIFKISEDDSDSLLSSIADEVSEAAKALGLNVPSSIKYEDVMREANKHLADETLSYQELTWRLEKTLEERDKLSAELHKELELAREIQRSLLPDVNGVDSCICGMNISAKEVSGDFYDFFTLDDGRIYFNLADVSGKGMNAALLMVKSSSLFHCLGKTIKDPVQLMNIINAELFETSTRGMFVTMVGGIYTPETGDVTLVNAGHQPVIYIKDNSLNEIEADAPPLGILPNIGLSATTFNIKDGFMFIYTDGLPELYDKADPGSSTHEMITLFNKIKSLPRGDRIKMVTSELKRYEKIMHDDLTILLIDGCKSKALIHG